MMMPKEFCADATGTLKMAGIAEQKFLLFNPVTEVPLVCNVYLLLTIKELNEFCQRKYF